TVAADHQDGPLSEVSAALRVAARAALAEVEAAISRMAIGEYGICQHCGGDIAIERLEIVPMAALCMDCQRAEESAEIER
ncbi:MAG: TraR/DksA C4-type zinc finger protein, partial [Jatrophihabitantaceae bacterium]